MTPLYFPKATGFAALAELDTVPWRQLAHAHGIGLTGPCLWDDVRGSLRALGTDAPQALLGLASNIWRQGTTYEAAASAVPFIAALIAGKVDLQLRRDLVVLLGRIEQGERFDRNLGPRLVDAFKGSAANLRAAAGLADAPLAELIHAIIAATQTPSIELSALFDDTFERFEEAVALSRRSEGVTAD